MSWYDDDTIKRMAEDKGISYRDKGARDRDYSETIDAGERGHGRYEYDGHLYRTKEDRDYAHYCDHY